MKKALASMLALLGIHQHLSAEQKQDIAIAAVQPRQEPHLPGSRLRASSQ
jgi:hypothetical protein